jgi:hypothetical protein
VIPEHTLVTLKSYLDHRHHPGGFLEAVLTNDLFGAVMRADLQHKDALGAIVQYVYQTFPSSAYGDKERFWNWLGNQA